MKMARRGKARLSRHSSRRRRKAVSKDKGYEQSDEDYMVNENELFDVSDDESFSFVGDDTSGESLDEYEDTEEEEMEEFEDKKQKKVVRRDEAIPKASQRQKNVVKRRKRRRVVYRGEDANDGISDDNDDDEDDEFIPYEINGVVKRKIRKRVVYREDDDDDMEFTLDEIDCADDEEDELPMTRGKKKTGKRQFPKCKGERVQRKRVSKVSKKITGKKPRKHCRKKTREKRRTIKQNAGQGRMKRRLIIDSDSDFVSYGSSDLEYTISEEEREQVREACKFTRGLTARWRSPAYVKNPPEEKTKQSQKKCSLSKGKEKIEESKTEAGKGVCGICFSEEGKKTIQGKLNCCNHYFCFACIMEWSKVESRCPLCKQRFATISKAAKSNVRAVLIHVPERDQVYQPSEEELRGYLDPYENVICTECQQDGDDAHMLLCDICDSPAHTYCVGLGHEVPEGDWYCEGCRLNSHDFLILENLNPMPETESTSVNMRETFELNQMYAPDSPSSQETCNTSSPRDGQAYPPASVSVASTVSDRRRIRRRITRFLNNRMRHDHNANIGL